MDKKKLGIAIDFMFLLEALFIVVFCYLILYSLLIPIILIFRIFPISLCSGAAFLVSLFLWYKANDLFFTRIRDEIGDLFNASRLKTRAYLKISP